MPFNKVADLVGDQITRSWSLFSGNGSANCNMMFILSIEKAVLLADLLMGLPPGRVCLGLWKCQPWPRLAT